MEDLKYFLLMFPLGVLYLIGGIREWYVLLRILWFNYHKVSPKTIRYGSIIIGTIFIISAVIDLFHNIF